ncbi:MAG: recombinase family protein [Rhodoferax sp.]|uniref:recombinase family protein n=1 Tax=Rhodoferax sp. TaxID=50421 RepID=UPI002618CCDC|nr:recombinase family protein [Rhodoferax sp.]MDD5333650.1 recombinase family protein [Rhodoferax sp.]MDD5333660.1 recombinase family protein [Rhodoferax sp.]
MRKVGYARVSTVDQDTALQLDALKKAGVYNVFREAGSGVGPRPELQRALGTLCAGDVLVVWKIDRVARSLGDLLSILAKLKSAGAAIRSLTEPIDTSTPIGEFTFQILGAVAQLERSMIRERVMAGQAAARARGKRWGAPRQIDPDSERELVKMYLSDSYTIDELADIWGVGYGVARGAILRVCNPRHQYLSRRR